MDQFCAGANDTYRRCICSEKFREFGDMEAALDRAKSMLQSFVDNNLENVTLSAAEVSAMYSATAGELAATRDKSAAAKMLEEIGDLLSGKTKPQTQQQNTLDFSNLMDFGSAMDDVWGGGDGIFGGGNKDLTNMDGKKLYDEVNRQCSQMAESSCETAAQLQMARSAYGLIISQDCQAYSKKIDAQKEQVAQKVREANKLLREARLEEYRDHNSASVNECITKVRADIMNDAACGQDYKRCLDFTGLYINNATGEPIFSPRLFQLANQIILENPNAPENKAFLNGLDGFKNRARASLDSCRDDANAVWDAFRRQALIEIAQAQDRKLEEVKNSCIMTMKECYDNVSGAMRDFDDTTAQATGALSARAASAMCADKVAACANLYTDPTATNCVRADAKNLANTKGANVCGLKELLAFVSVVDTVRIGEGCKDALQSFISDTCAPASTDKDHKAPYGCRLTTPDKLREGMRNYAKIFCEGDEKAETLDPSTERSIDSILETVKIEIGSQLEEICTENNGIWILNPRDLDGMRSIDIEPTFANKAFGGLAKIKDLMDPNLASNTRLGALTSSSSRSALVRSAVRARETLNTASVFGTATTSAAQTISDAVAQSYSVSAPQAVSYSVSAPQTLSVSAAPQTLSISSPQTLTLQPVNQQPLSAVGPLITVSEDAKIGWGLCLLNDARVKCDLQNVATGGKNEHVSWDGNRCVFGPNFAQKRCEMLSNAVWKPAENECWVTR